MLSRLTAREIPSRIVHDLRQGMFDLLWFEMLFKAATLLVVLPLATWAFRWVVGTSGHQAVGNLDILVGLQFGELLITAAGTRIPLLLVVLGTLLALNLFVAAALGFLLVTVDAVLISRLYREACRRSSIPLERLETGTALGERPGRSVPRKWIFSGALVSLVLGTATVWSIVEVDVGSWFGPEFAGERLPTLDEVIGAVRGRAGLVVEIKSYGADGRVLVAKVVEALRAQGMSDAAAIMSLEHAEVREARRLAPEIPAGFVASAAVGRLDRLDVDFLAVPVSRARSVLITAAHQQQKELWVWTVNDRARMWRLIDYGVDNIITDEPAKLHEVLRERDELDNVERLLLRFRHYYID